MKSEIDAITRMRHLFSEEVRRNASVRNESLIQAFAQINRHEFLGAPPWLRVVGTSAVPPYDFQYQTIEKSDLQKVYSDCSIVLDTSIDLHNGHPSTVATWIDSLNLKRGGRVCHIGCGTGYYTAILRHLVGDAGYVEAYEIEPDLVSQAQRNLQKYSNVKVFHSDGVRPLQNEFDAILVSAGAAYVPREFLAALAIGGRLSIPLTLAETMSRHGIGYVLTACRRTKDRFDAQSIPSVSRVYNCASLQQENEVAMLEHTMIRSEMSTASEIWLSEHESDELCWLHRDDVCIRSRPAEM